MCKWPLIFSIFIVIYASYYFQLEYVRIFSRRQINTLLLLQLLHFRMSKVSFRTRQIDFNRSLQIVKYDSEQYRELGEGAFVNRGAPTVPSGMEREEENVWKPKMPPGFLNENYKLI